MVQETAGRSLPPTEEITPEPDLSRIMRSPGSKLGGQMSSATILQPGNGKEPPVKLGAKYLAPQFIAGFESGFTAGLCPVNSLRPLLHFPL